MSFFRFRENDVLKLTQNMPFSFHSFSRYAAAAEAAVFGLLLCHIFRIIIINAFVLLMFRNNDSILTRIRLMTHGRARASISETPLLLYTNYFVCGAVHVNAMNPFRLYSFINSTQQQQQKTKNENKKHKID